MPSVTITDPALLDLLQKGGEVEIKDADGHVLGTFALELRLVPPPGMKSPFSDEEIARRRTIREGRTLAEIMRDLEGRG